MSDTPQYSQHSNFRIHSSAKHNKKAQRRTLVALLCAAALLIVLFAACRADSASNTDTVCRITAVGDIHMEPELLADAKNGTDYDFSAAFFGVASILSDADITVGNLECSLAGQSYTETDGWAPDALAGTLSGLGFDVLQTANSCSILGGLEGLTRTMQALQDVHIACAGTSLDQKDYKSNYGLTEIEVCGMRVVFAAFTKGLNNMSLSADADYAVNLLYEDYDTNYTTIARTDIEAVMAAARKRKPDILIALVHWGAEDTSQRSQTQEEIADLLTTCGADVILGSHSHQPGPLETRTVTDDDGEKHTAFIAYDLGEFYTASQKTARQGIALQLEFSRNRHGDVTLTDYSYTPLFRTSDPAGQPQYQVWDAALAKQLYQQSYVGRISGTDYENLEQTVTDIVACVEAKQPHS